MPIDWLVYHVASGHAFFSGSVLTATSVVLRASLAETSRWRRMAAVVAITGTLFIAISATPLPWFAYGLLTLSLLIWGIMDGRETPRRRRAIIRGTMVAVVTTLCAIELPYHVSPSIPHQSPQALAIIADSVTAGIGEKEAVTWPNLIADQFNIVVHDHSQMGATVSSARKQASQLVAEDDIVVLEIGGNDLLGGTTPEAFATSLDALLADVAQPGRTVIMFELPLPPTFNRFGQIQRRLAAKHEVTLVPKRVLMGVLTGSDATLDSIHLSQSGHDRMAEAVWSIVGDAFDDN